MHGTWSGVNIVAGECPFYIVPKIYPTFCVFLFEFACVGANTNFIEHITSSYLLGDDVSSIEDRRSATLKRVALTSL